MTSGLTGEKLCCSVSRQASEAGFTYALKMDRVACEQVYVRVLSNYGFSMAASNNREEIVELLMHSVDTST
ncbi:Hypothetical protein POVR2_LOCUS163 [uncultured virus]|nr:Hypothetical protein POVR2_LOCUS163 [uncultured virus]